MTSSLPPTTPALLPVRDGSRNGTARICLVCVTPVPSTRARYCSAACRQYAFRLRHVDLLAGDVSHIRHDLRRRRALVAHTVYECPTCGERLVGVRRCPDCHVFCRALGPGGHCPDCEQPILLADLLGTEPTEDNGGAALMP
jgi:ribosomal protein L32